MSSPCRRLRRRSVGHEIQQLFAASGRQRGNARPTVGLRPRSAVLPDRLLDGRARGRRAGSAQEAQPDQRRGPPLARSGPALADAVGQRLAHVVQEQVAVKRGVGCRPAAAIGIVGARPQAGHVAGGAAACSNSAGPGRWRPVAARDRQQAHVAGDALIAAMSTSTPGWRRRTGPSGLGSSAGRSGGSAHVALERVGGELLQVAMRAFRPKRPMLPSGRRATRPAMPSARALCSAAPFDSRCRRRPPGSPDRARWGRCVRSRAADGRGATPRAAPAAGWRRRRCRGARCCPREGPRGR